MILTGGAIQQEEGGHPGSREGGPDHPDGEEPRPSGGHHQAHLLLLRSTRQEGLPTMYEYIPGEFLKS